MKTPEQELLDLDPKTAELLTQAAKAEAEEMYENDQKKSELDSFLAQTKERFDKHFDNLGYVCIVFDKENPENQYIASISNVPFKGFMGKILKFVAGYKKNLKSLGKLRL